MGIVIRQSFWSSVSAYIGVGIGYLNAVILMPLFMEPEEIGLMRVVMSIAMLLASLANFGMGAALIRQLPTMPKNEPSLNRLFTLCLSVIMITSLLVGFFLFLGENYFNSFFDENSPDIKNYIGLIFFIMISMNFFKLLEATSTSQKSIILPNFIRDVLYKALNSLAIVLFGIGLYSFSWYLNSHLIIYQLLIFALLLPISIRYGLRLDVKIFQNSDFVKSTLKYASIVIMSGFGWILIVQIDQIMISKFVGLGANGIYTTALFMATVIELPKKFVSQISSPIISESFANNNVKGLSDHYEKASINQLILGLLIFLPIALNLDNIYSIMPNGQEYLKGKNVFIFLGVSKLIDMGFSLNGEIIGHSKYYRFNLYAVSLLVLVSVLTNLYLIPIYGIEGAAYATLISYVIFNVGKFWFVKYKFGLNPFSSKTTIILILAGVVVAFNFIIPVLSNPLLDLISRGALLVVIFAGGIYVFNASEEINNIIHQLLKPKK